MIYFHFQNIELLQLYNKCVRMQKFCNNFFKRDDILFIDISGSFPYCYWNGNINSNKGNLLLRPQIENLVNTNGIPFCLNISNLNLKDIDLKDHKLNAILNICDNGSNSLEVANFDLATLLKQTYPNYNYILSDNLALLKSYTADELNTIIESTDFNLIKIPTSFTTDLDFLRQLKQKNKLCLFLNTYENSCNLCNKCKLQEQIYQYNFSRKSSAFSCGKCLTNIEAITLDAIEDIYEPMGFKHFILPNIINDNNIVYKFIYFFVDYFIKHEYKTKAIDMLLN